MIRVKTFVLRLSFRPELFINQMYKNISSDQSIIEESFAYANKCWSSHLINPKYVEHTPNELIVRLLARFFNRGLKLIDIGSGYGKNSLTLAQHFYQVDLVDASLSSSSCYASLAQDCDNINIYKKYVIVQPTCRRKLTINL